MDPMTQTAPYPEILDDLVKHLRLWPGWKIYLVDMQRDEDHGRGTAGGLTLVIRTARASEGGFDTYHLDDKSYPGVNHFFPVIAATFNERAWRRWVFDRYCEVFVHEACETFVEVDDDGGEERPFAPNHGPGANPYTVVEYATDEERRTSFRGVLNDA